MTVFAELTKIVTKHDTYDAIKIWCPGCEAFEETGGGYGGLHMLPVSGNADVHPVWSWNGDLVKVTLSPSIKTSYTYRNKPYVCHSFLRDGVWEFLNDSTHSLSGQKVSMSPLPSWVQKG